MGSACCTAARSKETYCASDGWSMEPSRYDHHLHRQENRRRNPSALIHSRWARKSQVSKSTMEDVCMMPPNRSPFSSSTRSFRSNSSSGGGTISSNQMQDSGDVNLTIYNNSPFSESLQRSRASFDDGYDDDVILHQDSSGFRSGAFSFQDSVVSGSSNSFGSMSQKAMGSESTTYNSQKQTISSDGLSASSLSKQKLESSSHVSSSEMEALRRRVRSNMDIEPTSTREKAFPFKMPVFSDLMESSHAGSSRWASVDSPDSYASTGFGDINDGFVWNLGAICNQESEHSSRSKAQTCGLCSKEISRKPPWSFSRFPGSKELPVVGILDCGHVYHAECLDHATPATNAHDPPCPKCEMEKRFQSKSPEGIIDAVKPCVGYSGPLCLKGKSSKVGNISEDLSIYKSLQMSQYFSEGSSRKGPMQSLVRNHDHKSFSAKSLLRKQFNFKGKLYKESHVPKRPGYAARVSPENSTREDE